jgi:Multidrug resistance efflux pump
MPKKIKTRNRFKPIKTTIAVGQRMKQAYLKARKQVPKSTAEQETYDLPTDFAEGKVSSAAQQGVRKIKGVATKGVKNALGKDKKVHFSHDASLPIKTESSTAPNAPEPPKVRRTTPKHSPTRQGQQTPQAQRHVKKKLQSTIKTKPRQALKTAEHSIKTAQRTGEAGIKTARAAQQSAADAAKAAQRTAQTTRAAAKATQHTMQTAQTATKTALTTAKTAVRASVSAIKGIIAAGKSLVTAIAAGSWVVVAVVLIICMVGILLTSPFGIFFSGENDRRTVRSVVNEINLEYQERIKGIKSSISHDHPEISGIHASWIDVLAIYAVTTNGGEHPQDVVVMDEGRAALLRSVFWSMTDISRTTQTIHYTDPETEEPYSETTLYITISGMSAVEAAENRSFTAHQQEQLAELLLPEYISLWNMVLYGLRGAGSSLVAVAITQLGNVGGEPYWSWYGYESRVDWCACFVSWCAEQSGLLAAGAVPRFSYVPHGVDWFKERGQWLPAGSIPAAGDIIFFDWQGDGHPDHVGIVEYVEDGVVHAIEGNSGDICRKMSYEVESSATFGYGRIS